MNKLIPLLAIGYIGAITNLLTDAKSLFGALAALASFIASCYAIAIARKKLKQIPSRKPLRHGGQRSNRRPSRSKTVHKLVARSPLLIAALPLHTLVQQLTP